METSRQDSIVDPSILESQHVLIIGIGAVGELVLETLTRNGIPKITIFDFDLIEEHNCVTQGYYPDQIEQPKVEAASEKALRINPNLVINVVNDHWRPMGQELKIAKEHGEYDAIFSCVDSFATRKLIFKYYKKKERLKRIFDCRISAEVIRVLSAYDDDSVENYSKSFYKDTSTQGVGCHIPMIKHSAAIGSGLLVQQYFSHLMDRPMYPDRLLPLEDSCFINLFEESTENEKDKN